LRRAALAEIDDINAVRAQEGAMFDVAWFERNKARTYQNASQRPPATATAESPFRDFQEALLSRKCGFNRA